VIAGADLMGHRNEKWREARCDGRLAASGARECRFRARSREAAFTLFHNPAKPQMALATWRDKARTSKWQEEQAEAAGFVSCSRGRTKTSRGARRCARACDNQRLPGDILPNGLTFFESGDREEKPSHHVHTMSPHGGA